MDCANVQSSSNIMALHLLWQSFKQWRQQHENDGLEEKVTFLSDDDLASIKEKTHKRKINTLRFWTIINLLILGLSIFTTCLRFLPGKPHIRDSAVRETSYYSPILKGMDVKLEDVKFNGTLWPPENPSWMRQEPSPEVDAIWETYEPMDVFSISREDVVGLGKDPDMAVTLDDRFGKGPDRYLASFDMLHKTHCLNELRKMTFEAYGAQEPVKKRHGRFWWVHLRHCVDMLMQDQLCHADADVIIYNWVDTQQYPWPDLSVNRKCRSWDQMLQWGRDRFLQFDLLRGFTKPEGAKQLPFEPGYYQWFGFNGSDLYPNGTGYDLPIVAVDRERT